MAELTEEKIIDKGAMYTKNEVMKILKISRSTFYRWIHNGQLKHVKIGSHVRVKGRDISEFIGE